MLLTSNSFEALSPLKSGEAECNPWLMRQRDKQHTQHKHLYQPREIIFVIGEKDFPTLWSPGPGQLIKSQRLVTVLDQFLSLATSAKERMWIFWDFCVWMSQVLCIILALLYLKEHLPDLLMSALQPNLLYILYIAAADPNVFLLLLAVVWRAYFPLWFLWQRYLQHVS